MKSSFQTEDMDLAAYLCACGYKLVAIKSCTDQLTFVFDPDAALTAEGFYFGATVSAKNVLHAVRQLQHISRRVAN